MIVCLHLDLKYVSIFWHTEKYWDNAFTKEHTGLCNTCSGKTVVESLLVDVRKQASDGFWNALGITLDMRTLFQTKYRCGRKESYALSQRWIGEEERLSRCTLSHHKQDKSCHQWWEQHCALIFNSVNLRKTCLCFLMKEDGKQVELNTEVTRSKIRRY